MKKGILTIQVFNVLDNVKDHFRLTDYQWAEKAFGDQKYQSRISEIRNKGVEEGKGKGRPFSAAKCVLLVNGLAELIGRDTLEKELSKRLDSIESAKERMILMILALPEKKEKTTELYLREALNEDLTTAKK